MDRRNGTAGHLARVLALGFIALAAFTGDCLAVGPDYPLKVSPNHRYLVDQKNVPFLMVGDSPQALIGNLSVNQAKKFMANRARYGVNALWVNLLCDSYTACNADGTTFDGIAPFTTQGDLSTPNPPISIARRRCSMLRRQGARWFCSTPSRPAAGSACSTPMA